MTPLPIPPEPTDDKRATRGQVEQCPGLWPKVLDQPGGVLDYLWGQWRDHLETAGLDRPSFDAIVAGYRPELWHWLWGNRLWTHCATGLAGRLTRRM